MLPLARAEIAAPAAGKPLPDQRDSLRVGVLERALFRLHWRHPELDVSMTERDVTPKGWIPVGKLETGL